MREPLPSVRVVGEGVLRTAVDAALRKSASPAADLSAVVVVSDAWEPDPVARAGALSVPLLPIGTELGHVVIGPLTTPGTPGCWTCAELRRDRNHPGRAAVRARHGDALASRPSSALNGFAADAVGALAAAEIAALSGGGAPRTRGAFLRVALADLTVRTHRVLADPLCPRCGVLPDDTAKRATIVPEPRPKPHPGAFRLRSAGHEHRSLLAHFVDPESGLIAEVRTGDEGGLPVARAPLAMRGTTAEEAGWGRSDTYRASELTAVLEAVERWGGLQAGGRRTTVRGSYRALREGAVHPPSLGLYGAERYAEPGFPFVPFDEDLELRWVWAHSFARGRPVLVPETYAYYGAHVLHRDEPRLAYEISNGCALGSCREEAILYGLLEVAERDAFLMAWYARRPLPRVDLASAADPRVRLLAAHLEEETDRTVTVLDTTVEQGIPCVWAIAVDRTDDPGRARALCAGGSHIDPERAVLNALCELGPILASVDRTYPGQRARVSEMAGDSGLVRTMGDHSLLYADASVFSRLEFLFASGRSVTLPAMVRRSVPVSPTDLTEDVLRTVGRYLDTGLDVLVVDQTTPEQEGAGLSCVKVIVPGTLPMTFGHGMRRVEGLPRLFDVPRLLGDPAPPSSGGDLNPFPHPFP
ncbi:TOMM precursor leader peptide-binding protein [Streptomyces sp. NPDC087866]|uniref:TOMM precursor leader peptide-binding protein n=1 Tax=unclassified Streptomyces TaxID=2593676 RepID=UPI0033BD2367